MPYFTKKPVQIEAREHTGSASSAAGLIKWIVDQGGEASAIGEFLLIETLEGRHRANPGDWIIRGVKGEFYPCKPDIFAATYDPS
jgi:hypothetical protein